MKNYFKLIYYSVLLYPTLCFSQVQIMGDTMLGSKNNNLTQMENFFTPVDSILKNKEIINIVNLEGVISGKDYTPKCSSGNTCVTFNMNSVATKVLFDNNINVANLANNHSMDFGLLGRKDTLMNLINYKISPVGTDDFPVAKFHIENKSFAIIGASPHHNTVSIFDTEHLSSLIHQYKSQGNIVIITAHIGREGANAYHVEDKDEIFLGQDRGNPIKLAHEMIDLGADAFLAHGPHVMRPLEIYKNRIIAYSLGNFMTYGTFNLAGNSAYGGILNVQFNDDGSFNSGHFFATEQTKSLNPKLWQKGNIIEPSEKSFIFLKTITNEHQPNTFTWNSDGGFTIKK
jgi:hypothetical protein